MILAMFLLIFLPVKGSINEPQPPVDINGQPIPVSSNITDIKNNKDWWTKIKKEREENKQHNEAAVNRGNVVILLQDKSKHEEKSVQDSTQKTAKLQPIKEKSKGDDQLSVEVGKKTQERHNDFHTTHFSYDTPNNLEEQSKSVHFIPVISENNSSKTGDGTDDIGGDVNSSVAVSEQPCYGTLCTHVVLVASSFYFYHTVSMIPT